MPALRECRAYRASAAILAQKEIQGVKAQKAMSGRRVQQALQALPARWVHRATSGFQARGASRGQPEQPGQPGLWGRKA